MNTKKCPKCETDLSLSQFYKNKSRKDGYSNYCKPCKKEANKKDYVKHKSRYQAQARGYKDKIVAYIKQYKENKFCKCGESHPACLQFHHKDPSTKSFNISDARKNVCSVENLQKEIDKCEIICANCHAKLHHR